MAEDGGGGGSGEATRSQPPGNKNGGVAGLVEGWWLMSEGVVSLRLMVEIR